MEKKIHKYILSFQISKISSILKSYKNSILVHSYLILLSYIRFEILANFIIILSLHLYKKEEDEITILYEM